MATEHAKKAAASYADEVLGPIAEKVEDLPEEAGDGEDEALLNRMLTKLDAGLLKDMTGGGLVESLAAAGTQAALVGRAATPKQGVESSE